jgi:hypothetical protein
MEMGRGFALVDRQFPMRIIEETGADQECVAGKMSFYLIAVDELERQPGDEPTIGLALCPGRSKTVTPNGRCAVCTHRSRSPGTRLARSRSPRRRLRNCNRCSRTAGARKYRFGVFKSADTP